MIKIYQLIVFDYSGEIKAETKLPLIDFYIFVSNKQFAIIITTINEFIKKENGSVNFKAGRKK